MYYTTSITASTNHLRSAAAPFHHRKFRKFPGLGIYSQIPSQIESSYPLEYASLCLNRNHIQSSI
jgi:hypothetical protein